jgi:hypothetical protein
MVLTPTFRSGIKTELKAGFNPQKLPGQDLDDQILARARLKTT